MAGIKISLKLRNKLPEIQRKSLEEALWEQSSGQCFLCEEPLNRANDDIQVDHDEAQIEEGETSIENLNLVHRACNAAKRNSPTVEIKPYLKLAAFIKKHEGSVRYGECTKHFGIKPQAIVVNDVHKGVITIELPGGEIVKSPVYKSTNSEGTFEYCYVQVPREALFNDDDCQPRNIKLPQVWAIYIDLQKNPLHEPPGCRLLHDGKLTKLVMFDGQHKTVASWMAGEKNIVVKLYLNITLQQTIRLVNSVQAKIKKLPLSPFEIAAKLADEWQGQLGEYESDVGAEKMSEQGFIDWLKPTDRRRGKQAFEEACLQQLLDREDLAMLRFVKHAGTTTSDDELIPEATFKSKVVKELIHTKPLSTVGDEGQLRRSRESENIVKVLNYFAARVFEPNGEGVALNDSQKEIRRRFSYQAALKFVSEMLPKVAGTYCHKEPETVLLDAKITEEQWTSITAAFDRILNHPIWSKKFDIGEKSRAVEQALLKNQGVKEALASVGLTFGYIVGGESLDSDWHN